MKFIDITSIYPDPAQPRRAIPSELREQWNIHQHSFEDLIVLWFQYMEPGFDMDAYLLDGDTKRAQRDEHDEPLFADLEPENAIQASLVRLFELASSILREGLTNPITVSRMGREYLIETGERRWLAYNLLNWYFYEGEDQDWSKIPARVMPERSVWRQASENNARQNLNAVSRARQLAILLMDIHGWENFRPISEFENEQNFYRQVSDGREWRIPKDKTEQLLKAMGLNNQTQLRQYRAILRKSPEIWREADDNDWTENYIRELDRQQPEITENSKSVTSVTEKDQFSVFDQAIARIQNQRNNVKKQVERSTKKERRQWLEIAREQSEWWNQLARELEDGNS